MKVGFFGHLGELLGREVEVDVAGAKTVADLRGLLAQLYPSAAEQILATSLKAIIEDGAVHDDHSIGGIARVEFFPPLSGG